MSGTINGAEFFRITDQLQGVSQSGGLTARLLSSKAVAKLSMPIFILGASVRVRLLGALCLFLSERSQCSASGDDLVEHMTPSCFAFPFRDAHIAAANALVAGGFTSLARLGC